MAAASICFVLRYTQTAGEFRIQEIIQDWSIKIKYGFMYQLQIYNLKQNTVASLPSGEMGLVCYVAWGHWAEKAKSPGEQL